MYCIVYEYDMMLSRPETASVMIGHHDLLPSRNGIIIWELRILDVEALDKWGGSIALRESPKPTLKRKLLGLIWRLGRTTWPQP